MIPFMATVSVEKKPRGGYHFWVPLGLLWLVLLPVVLLLLPVFFVACMVVRVNPFEALWVFWDIVTTLKGTDIEIGECDRSVSIRIF
jgi:hypothetical protein